jgi:hypothetical protein
MSTPRTVSRSRSYPINVDEAFAQTLSLPLELLFSQRYGPIPPIRRTTQDGEWDSVGQVRTVHLADGGSMREELKTVDPPREFTYQLTDVTGPMKPLAESVDGTWHFDPRGTGCQITWTWVIHPRSAIVGRLVLPVFARLWNGYARRALDNLEDLLVAY